MSFDHYVYPGTNVLKNKFGIMDASILSRVERDVSSDNAARLLSRNVTGSFDVMHLKDIHKCLFGDIYEWAGEFRMISTYKGGTEFAAPDEIEAELEHLCGRIRDDGYFKGLSKRDTACRLADTLCVLNMIHPFREGNGRTQRLFVEQMALDARYDLDFSGVSENDMRDASFAAARGDRRLMRYLVESNMNGIGLPEVSIQPDIPDVRPDMPDSDKQKSFVQKALSLFGHIAQRDMGGEFEP